jgi:hypothetical protein
LVVVDIQTPITPIVHPKMNMEKSVPEQNAPVIAPVFTALRFWHGERDRPGCRFRRRAENPSPKLNGSTNGSGATPEPAGETPALPPIVQPKMNTGKEFPSACIRFHLISARQV